MANSRKTVKTDLRAIAHEAMLQRGLLPEFSAAVLAQAEGIAAPARGSGPGVRDLRHLPWASIDNDDSRDLDQLSVAQPLAGGAVQILVAIADVDALVAKDSPIDGHALTNTTSVYTAAQIFPMLPEKLSTDLTSLNESQVRLAVVIDMTVAADGTVTAGDIYRAAVYNHAKLAYNSVAAWLEGTGPAPEALTAVAGLDEQLRIQDRAAQAMRNMRETYGALRLETAEARPVFEDDVLVDMRPDPRNRAKDLIEDFMVAANGVSAKYLEKKGYPSLRRVLHTPKRWDRIVALAAELGARLPAKPSAPALDAFLDARRQADPEGYPDVSLAVVKLLGSGEYALELPGADTEGHFGLAVRDYTHSTAPNRRFPDLIAQRLLKAAIAGVPSPYANEELATLAAHCTTQEDNANKVERQVRKSAAALLMASRIGARFNGIVTGASEKGTWVRVTGPMAEGRVVRGFEGLDVGDHVRVELVRTDVARGFIDFARARERS
ncbi:MAG: RNB domain-containing ribonuclease [Betaproteobacteria bacterium]|nr:RNB domain-containing ribonuclease [Betaproteobacteria bacterium]